MNVLSEGERALVIELRAAIADAAAHGDLVGHVRGWLGVAQGRVWATDRWQLTPKGRLALEDCAAGRCADCRHYVPDAVRPEAGRCAVKCGGWYGVWASFGCVRDFAPTGTVAEDVPAPLEQVSRA